MAEYINRRSTSTALYEVYEHAVRNELARSTTIPSCEAKNILLRFEKALNAVPAADVVEVVRCGECVYFLEGKLLCTHEGNRVFNTGKTTYPNCFCSYGGRRETNADHHS